MADSSDPNSEEVCMFILLAAVAAAVAAVAAVAAAVAARDNAANPWVSGGRVSGSPVRPLVAIAVVAAAVAAAAAGAATLPS